MSRKETISGSKNSQAILARKSNLNQVLLLADGEDVTIGAPYVDGSKVMGEVEEQARAKKIEIIKFKRRKHHMKRMGHRQSFTQVKITGISK